MLKLLMNKFRNRFSDVRVQYLMDNFDDSVHSQSEDHWRNTIANEIYHACPATKHKGYPCEECYELFEFILYKKETSHDG